MFRKKFVFIMFPPGMGGNHFRNMLGLYTGEIEQEIVEHYENLELSVHKDVSNLQKNNIISRIESSKDIVLLCGHVGEYLFLKFFFDQLKHKQFLVFKWAEHDVIPLKNRMIDLDCTYITDKYVSSEQRFLYKNLHLLVGQEVIDIPLKSFLTKDILPLLSNTATAIGLPNAGNEKLCVKLHSIWLQNNVY